MPFMDAPPPLPPAQRLARLIAAVIYAVGLRCGRDAYRIELPNMILPGPLATLIGRRLQRISNRFAAIAARIEAGTFRTRRHPARPPSPDPLSPDPLKPKRTPPPPLPQYLRGAGWLFRLVPEARVRGSHLRILLAEPDMAALLAECQQLCRVIRPLCRMLNVAPPPIRRAPRKPRPARPPAPPPAPPKPQAIPRAAPTSGYVIQEVPQRWRLNPFPPGLRRRGGRGPPIPA